MTVVDTSVFARAWGKSAGEAERLSRAGRELSTAQRRALDALRAVRDLVQRRRLVLSAVVLFELERGAAPQGSRRRALDALYRSRRARFAPIDARAARAAGLLSRELQGKGASIGDADELIAATCLAHGYELLTTDEHFRGVPGLAVTVLSGGAEHVSPERPGM